MPASRRRTATLLLGLVWAIPLGTLPAQRAKSGFLEWARAHARPLTSLDPASPLDDLGPLRRVVGGARVVGLGESLHDMHQFLTIRHRVLRLLVEEMRFTALALESGLPEARLADDYVAGRSDSLDYDRALNYGFGRDRELRDALRWMRAYNADPSHLRKLRVYGLDLPASAGSALPALDGVLAYLGQVDTAEAGRVRLTLLPLAGRAAGSNWQLAQRRYDSLPPAARDSLTREAEALVTRLDAAQDRYPARSSADQYAWAARLAEVVRQMVASLRLGFYHPSNPRDVALAANLRWVLEREGSEGRVLVWAHNAHVQRVPIEGPASPVPRPVETMGRVLQRWLGRAYVAIGFTYGALGDGPLLADSTSLDGTLSQVGRSAFLLPFSEAPSLGPVAEALRRPTQMRFQNGFLRLRPGEAFDAVFFVERITPARPEGGGRR